MNTICYTHGMCIAKLYIKVFSISKNNYRCHFWVDGNKVEIEHSELPEPVTTLLLDLALMGLVGIRRTFQN